jgi:hypothetical protein
MHYKDCMKKAETYLDERDGADKLSHDTDPLIPRFEQILRDGDTALRDKRVEGDGDDEYDDAGKGSPPKDATGSATHMQACPLVMLTCTGRGMRL